MSLTGNLVDLSLSDIFQVLAMSRRTGTLDLDCPPYGGHIVFADGRVTSACVLPASSSLGENLKEAGVIAESLYPFMLLAEAAGMTLPDVFAQFELPLAHVNEICAGLLKRTVLTMFGWRQGTFTFNASERIDPFSHVRLSAAWHVCHGGLSPQYLALEGARLDDERHAPAERASPPAGPSTSPLAPVPLSALVGPLLEDSFKDFDDPGAPALPQAALVAPVEHLFDLRQELAGSFDAGEPEVAANVPAPTGVYAEMATLRAMLAELREAHGRNAVVLLVLRFASLLVERAAVFVPQGSSLVGLGGFCSVDLPGNDQAPEAYMMRVRKLRVERAADHLLWQVQTSRLVLCGPLAHTAANAKLVTALGGPWPTQKVVAAPLIARDRVALVLFGDNPSGKMLSDTEGLEIFLQQAGLALERVAVP